MQKTASRRRPRHARRQLLRLADGRRVWLRPIAVTDAAPIAAGFPLLDEEEVRRRYQHPMKALGDDYLQQLVAPDPALAAAYVIAEPLPSGIALVGGVGRIVRIDGGSEAEFAILVARFIAGQGLGKALMRRLFEWAAAHGVRRLRGDVLEDNEAMLRLALALGFRRDPGRQVPGQIHVVAEVSPRRRRPR